MSFKTDDLRNFEIFTGKHLYWSLFLIKMQALRPATLFKRLQHRCLLVNMAKFLLTAFFIEHLRWYLSIFSVLIKNNEMVYTKKIMLEYVIYILLVETIPTRFHWLICRKQKLVQSKTVQLRLFVLILGFWQWWQVFVHYLMSILMIWK